MFIRKSAFVIIPSLALSITACDEPLRPDPPDPQFGATASEPAAPTMVVVSAAYVHVLEVWWQDNSSNETGFEVEQSTTGPAGAFSKVATFAAALDATGIQHSYSDWGLPPITEYCYRVRALRAQGGKTFYSPYSSVLCATTLPPGAPTAVTPTAVSPTEIDLRWQDHFAVETSTELERSTTGAVGPFILRAELAANTMVYSDVGLQAITEYCYRVRTGWANGDSVVYSPFSDVACARTKGPPLPVTAVSTAPEASNYVHVSWTHDSGDASGFRVHQSTNGGAWQPVATLAGDQRDVNVGALTEPNTSCFRVIPFNVFGDAATSPQDCTVPPRAPTNLTSSAVGSTTVHLGWQDNSNIEDGYEVWVRISMGYWADCDAGCYWEEYSEEYRWAQLPANATAADVGVVNDSWGEVAYYVLAKSGGGSSSPSNSVAVPVP